MFGIPGTAGTLEHSGNRVVSAELSESVDFGDASLVILPALANLGGNSKLQLNATELLAKRIIKHVQQGGRVAIVYDAEGFHGPQWVGGRLLERWRIEGDGDPLSLARPYAREFQSYLQEYGYPGFVFRQQPGSSFQRYPIAGSDKDENSLSCFAVAEGRGLVYVLPANFVAGAEIDLLRKLIDAIEAHSRVALRPTTAPIADSFVFTSEADVRAERDAKQQEVTTLDATLTKYVAKKDILFLRDEPLADRVPEWIQEYLSFGAHRHEEYVEDFWLLDEQGNEAVICEAKGLTENVKRQHIRQLVLHRDQRDLPDDFPALLVANTFADAETEQDKGKQRVNPLECANAVKENVLIVRTLDLVRLLDQLERELVTPQDLWKLITTEMGWLKVEGDGKEVVKQ